MSEIGKYYLEKKEPAKSCLLALRDIIKAQNASIQETSKYGMPCFCYEKKIICYLWTDKKTEEPYILLADGRKLEIPELEAGKRTKMKIFRINPNEDIPVLKIQNIFKKVLDLHH